jgi:hypothetical protein
LLDDILIVVGVLCVFGADMSSIEELVVAFIRALIVEVLFDNIFLLLSEGEFVEE